MLAGVVVILVIALAAPLHRYLAARSAVGEAAQHYRDGQTTLADLQRQRAQWDDPAYVEQQARSRLQYAMPGDTVYVVVTPGSHDALTPARVADQGATSLPGQTWNERLWGSVRAADRGN